MISYKSHKFNLCDWTSSPSQPVITVQGFIASLLGHCNGLITVFSASVSCTCLQVWVNYHFHYISLLCSRRNPPDIVHHLIPTYLSKHSFHYFSSYTLSKLHATCMIYHLQHLAHNSVLSSCCLFGQVHLSIIPITCHPLMPQSYLFFGPNKNVTLGLH